MTRTRYTNYQPLFSGHRCQIHFCTQNTKVTFTIDNSRAASVHATILFAVRHAKETAYRSFPDRSLLSDQSTCTTQTYSAATRQSRTPTHTCTCLHPAQLHPAAHSASASQPAHTSVSRHAQSCLRLIQAMTFSDGPVQHYYLNAFQTTTY
jgi:hypothetical protein